MNYRCNCGEVFSEADALRDSGFDRSEAWGNASWENRNYLSSPCCGSEEIEEHHDVELEIEIDGDDDNGD